MGGGQEKPPVQRELQPGLEYRYAIAAGIQKVAQTERARHNRVVPYRNAPSAGEAFRIALDGNGGAA